MLRATLPAGTVSGAPKVRAMEIIDELEPVKRGPYAGVVGYVDFSGNLDTAIAIRTMFVGPNGASFQAGAGIVADSIPDDEDLECRNKAAALLAAVPAAAAWTGRAGACGPSTRPGQVDGEKPRDRPELGGDSVRRTRPRRECQHRIRRDALGSLEPYAQRFARAPIPMRHADGQSAHRGAAPRTATVSRPDQAAPRQTSTMPMVSITATGIVQTPTPAGAGRGTRAGHGFGRATR